MLTEELHAAGVADKIAGHEAAAHEKRNWVRLTFDCNNRCIFCLDSNAHDGRMRDAEEVKRQILDGRRAGATRLILSGGEPTIHPRFVDFVRLGRKAGYRRIQTVTNGRLFAYPEFLRACINSGLDEITFSIHGPDAKIHDALVGVKGAFAEEVAGLEAALAMARDGGRPIVNVDVVINRANVRHLSTMLDRFIALGVREFDLLQVVPFGRAYDEGKDTLFYDLDEARPHLEAALAYSKRPDLHLWFNRFPPQHLEGYEHLVQDPHKLVDEVRGRKQEFARLVDEGVALDCKEPERCRRCYLEKLCDTLDIVRSHHIKADFDVVRVDAHASFHEEFSFGGDPASARRAGADGETESPHGVRRSDGRVGLPLAPAAAPRVSRRTVEETVAASRARTLWIVAANVMQAHQIIARFPDLPSLELEIDDVPALVATLAPDGTLDGRRVACAIARTPAHAEALLAAPGDFEVLVELSRATEPWLLSLATPPARLALRQPSHEKLTEAATRDVDLRAFFARFTHPVPVEGVPACVTGRPPRPRPPVLDTAMHGPDGGLDIFRYAQRYIVDGYRTKSRRCAGCVEDARCDGLHVNHVRAHGYAVMQPIAR